MSRPRIGKLRPVYSLLLNPHADQKLSRCPHCQKLTFPRKFALFIHIEGWGPFVQGKTCKYCSKCKMILVQQDELEGELAISMQRLRPECLGSEYFIIGVVDTQTFKAAMRGDSPALKDTLNHVSDIKEQYGLGLTLGGWYREGAKRPTLPAHREQRIPPTAPTIA